MAFDLNTAKPVKFDLATAGPPTPPPRSAGPSNRLGPAREDRRARLEADLAAQTAEADATGERLDMLEPAGTVARAVARPLAALARGVVTGGGLLPMVEQAAGAMSQAQADKLGEWGVPDIPGIEPFSGRGPFTQAGEFFSPPELAPRDGVERFADMAAEGLGAMGPVRQAATGVANQFGRTVATQGGETTSNRVARTLQDNPGREALAVAGGAAGAAGASTLEGTGPIGDALASPLGQTLAAVAGGAPAAIGAGPAPTQGTLRTTERALPGLPAKQTLEPLPKPAQGPWEVARAARYALPPGVRPDSKGNFGESLLGPSYVDTRFAIENAKNTDALVREEIGMKGGRLEPASFEQLRQPHNAVYDEVRMSVPILRADEPLMRAINTLGTPNADNPLLRPDPAIEGLRQRLQTGAKEVSTADVLQAIRQWRKDARTLYSNPDDPEKVAKAEAYMDAANAFEDAIERAATAAGEIVAPDLVDRFRQARTQLAKINDVEAATIDGEVDPAILAKMDRQGSPLSGRLKIIAESARNFPNVIKHGPKVRAPQRETLTMFGQGKRLLQRGLSRGAGIDALFSDRIQGQFGQVDPNPGPGSPLGAYFDTGGSPFPPRPQQPFGELEFTPTDDAPRNMAIGRLAGDLDLVPEIAAPDAMPPVPDRLSAATPPPIAGDIDFTPSPLPMAGSLADQLAAQLGLAPASRGDIDFTPTAPGPEQGLREFLGLFEDSGVPREFDIPPNARIPEPMPLPGESVLTPAEEMALLGQFEALDRGQLPADPLTPPTPPGGGNSPPSLADEFDLVDDARARELEAERARVLEMDPEAPVDPVAPYLDFLSEPGRRDMMREGSQELRAELEADPIGEVPTVEAEPDDIVLGNIQSLVNELGLLDSEGALPPNAEFVGRRVEQLLDQGDYAKAMVLLQELLGRPPDGSR